MSFVVLRAEEVFWVFPFSVLELQHGHDVKPHVCGCSNGSVQVRGVCRASRQSFKITAKFGTKYLAKRAGQQGRLPVNLLYTGGNHFDLLVSA